MSEHLTSKQPVFVPVSGYAVAIRRGNNHKVFDLYPRTFGLRKDLTKEWPHVTRSPAYRIVRVTISKWVPERCRRKTK